MHRRTMLAGQAEVVPIRNEVELMEVEVEQLEQALEATSAPPIEGGRGG